ncbi:MAG TPA: electron transport complex subunit RsxE [Firmicutes bacterium]|nr:electron transport complex subunit E [Bacillota bacterium]HAA33876.1 electron transport complex subunit RsxE [Bacillota bacterium]
MLSTLAQEFSKGILKENPTFRLILGMCPTLAVTASAINGFGMGISALVVLLCSNILVAALRNVIPDKVRIPAYILIIATFTTIVDMVLNAFAPDLHKALGIFIPLIVVNCIILGRAEAFARKNNVVRSIIDALGMGLGFTLSLTILGIIRELFGSGSIFGVNVMGTAFEPMGILATAPGAFITLGVMLGFVNYMFRRLRIE